MIDRICSLLKMKKPALNSGLLFASGDAVPADGSTGYQTGCVFQHTDGAAGSAFYVNEGSASSCDFNAIETPGTLNIADLADVGATAYTAGKILVADGDSYEEVAVSGHAALAASGALTLATVAKTFTQPLTGLRKSAAGKDFLADAPDATDLGLADAIGSPVVGTTTNGGSTAQVNEKCAFDFAVPADYAGGDLTVRVNGLVSAARNAESLLDVVVKHIKAGALDATDLCTSDAVDMKAVTAAADKDFTVDCDASGDEIAAGSVLHVEVAFETDDTGATSDGYAQINAVQVLVPCYR